MVWPLTYIYLYLLHILDAGLQRAIKNWYRPKDITDFDRNYYELVTHAIFLNTKKKRSIITIRK